MNAGTTSFQSPTMPKRDDLKMVASGSLLMATMFLTCEMPAMCWLAPEMATAMYRSGVTTLPVRPTCVATGYQPRSHTARGAPLRRVVDLGGEGGHLGRAVDAVAGAGAAAVAGARRLEPVAVKR